MTMMEKLTLKKLSGELETLRTRVLELEQQLEHRLKTTLDKAVAKFGSRVESTNLPEHGTSIDAEHRQLFRSAAEFALLGFRRSFCHLHKRGCEGEAAGAIAVDREAERQRRNCPTWVVPLPILRAQPRRRIKRPVPAT